MSLLSVEDVRVVFGGVVALADLSFTIDDGQICALIGPNGAGKTTLFNCVSRLYQPTSGSIDFDGHDLLRMPAHRIARLGIARTFQNLALFPALTVLENVLVGGYTHGRVEREAARRCARDPEAALARRSRVPPGRRPAVRHAQAHRDRPRARGAARVCCCSTSRRPVSRIPRSTSSAS